jgi:hypothetical protein
VHELVELTDDCSGRKPPFLAVNWPPHPYKNTIERIFSMENAKAA